MNRSRIRSCVAGLGMLSFTLHGQTIPPTDVFISGEEGENFGWSVAGVGDMNNDGIDDLLIGAPASDALADFAGRAFLFFGPLNGNLVSADADVFFDPEGLFGDNFGISVANAGDVNGDGEDDIVIGARSSDAGGIQSGKAYLFHGPFSPGTIAAKDADAVFLGSAFDELGWSVASAGDVNNDGFDDVLIGGPNALGNLGRALLFNGPLSGSHTPADADASIRGEISDERLGSSVAGAGDVNNDGFDDVVIGEFSPLIGTRNAGRALLFYGPITGNRRASTADAQLVGEVTDDRFGIAVSSAGDVNQDGNADLLIGADQFLSNGPGKTCLFLGPLTGIVSATEAEAVVTGEGNGDLLGTTIGSAGDLNGDQIPDFLIGATLGGAPQAGASYVFYGPLTGSISAADADVVFAEEPGGGEFGKSIAATGDLDGDGSPDIAVGAPLSDFAASDAGRVYLFALPLISCEDISQFQARCQPGGTIQARVILTDNSHTGDHVEFTIDGIPHEATVGPNRRALLSLTGFTPGSHDVELTDPPGCFPPVAVTCPSSLGENGADSWANDRVENEGERRETPVTTTLLENYPDPFNPTTTISYAMSEGGHVTLSVYNMLGQLVTTLAAGVQPAGYHSVVWNGTNDFGEGVASGIYFFRMTAGQVAATRRMLLLR